MSVQLSNKKQKRLLPSPLSAVTHEDSVALLHASWMVGGHSSYSNPIDSRVFSTCITYTVYIHPIIPSWIILSCIDTPILKVLLFHLITNPFPSFSSPELCHLPRRLCTGSSTATSHVSWMLIRWTRRMWLLDYRFIPIYTCIHTSCTYLRSFYNYIRTNLHKYE